MPKINRIRILNFSYNNDTREIPDETFQFYDGENALLNLANGGGKSVLIQLFLQPILPDLRVQKRRMIDFFRRTGMPAYVMIEWLLDNPAMKDYLLTGIAIAPGNTANMEDAGRINFFTFASHYQKACDFDLEQVPFVIKEGERRVILPFERARESVRKLAGGRRESFYYGREDVGEYRKLLMQFGISQDEWRNIIARMNNDEGGLNELFDKCGTSDSVLNEWIIKNIEKSHLSEASEDTGILELMAGLVSDTLKNEEYLQAQKLMKAYLTEHQQLEGLLENLYRALDQCLIKEKQLSEMHQALSTRERAALMDLEELAALREELMDQRQHITLEELSERYWEILEELLETKSGVEQLQAEAIRLAGLTEDKRREKECQAGARLMQKLNERRGEESALRQQIEQLQGDYEVKGRMEDLAYSLRVYYENRCGQLAADSSKITAEIDAERELQAELSGKEQQDQKHAERLQMRYGVLKNKAGQFEQYEDDVFEKVEFKISRNLLNVLDEQEIKNAQSILDKNVQACAHALSECQEHIEANRNQQSKVALDLHQQEEKRLEIGVELEKARSAQADFLNREAECLGILKAYDLDSELLYAPEKLQSFFLNEIDRQAHLKFQNQSECEQVEGMIAGIQNHSVYLPKPFLQVLADSDIRYQTGEAYLQNLTEDRRRLQLQNNPLLPFSLIVEKQELAHLDRILPGYLRQVVPLFTYEQLGGQFAIGNGRVQVGGHVEFIAVYEERLFEEQQRETYLKQLENQRAELNALIAQREQETEQLHKARNTLETFSFAKGTKEQLAAQVEKLEALMEDVKNTLARLGVETEQLKSAEKTLMQRQPELQASLSRAEDKKKLFVEYLEKDALYRADISEGEAVYNELQEVKNRIQNSRMALEQSRTKETQQRGRLAENALSYKEAKAAAAKYMGAKEAHLLDEDIYRMEQEYTTLYKKQSSDFEQLQESLQRTGREINGLLEQQKELEVPPQAYEGLTYDPERERQVKAELKTLETKENDNRKKLTDTRIALANLDGRCKSAKDRLSENGLDQPLPKEEILQDYDRRRKKLKLQLDQLSEKERTLKTLADNCAQLKKRIKDVITVVPVSNSAFSLSDDMEKQFVQLRDACRAARTDEQQQKKKCFRFYQDLRQQYYGTNPCVEDILKSLEALPLEAAELSYDTVYYFLEEFMKKRESLEKLLDFYNGQLETLYHTKKQVIDQCISYGTFIYDEIKNIANRSKIRLSQKNRSVQMLKIDVPKETDQRVRERMTEYIDNSLQLLVKLSKTGEPGSDKTGEPGNDRSGGPGSDKIRNLASDKKLREKLALLTSGRALLNQIVGTTKIGVHVYKIDLNEKNSGLRRWEDAMAQNSGGEKFVVFFTLVSTLISYLREVGRRQAGGDAMMESKVLIMDNPFGRTSSEHLLKAVMDIARTFNIQLICLSDLNQSSITNRFSLCYQLSIRKRMYSDKEILMAGPVQMNTPGIEKNERLEHVELYENGRQIDMREWMEKL